jgi:thiazole synthase ThiGH ThiG subunit
MTAPRHHGLTGTGVVELLAIAIDKGLRAAVFARARADRVDPVAIADALVDALPRGARARVAAEQLARDLRPGTTRRALERLRRDLARAA